MRASGECCGPLDELAFFFGRQSAVEGVLIILFDGSILRSAGDYVFDSRFGMFTRLYTRERGPRKGRYDRFR